MIFDIVKNYELRENDNILDCITGLKKYSGKYRKNRQRKRVYFIGLHQYGNLGDNAIAVSMQKFLREILPDYELFTVKYEEVLMQMPLIRHYIKPSDMVVLIGGGSMGVEYFFEEELRRLVISYFPKNKIVIFPQTIDFGNSERGKAELKKTAAIYNSHAHLHIFAREEKSYEIMRKVFPSVDIHLVPDIVNYYSYQGDTEQRKDVLLCLRSDKEVSMSAEMFEELTAQLKENDMSYKCTDTVYSYIPDITTENIRVQLVENKLKEFAAAKVVLTDRVHGMIFAAITRTPCIVFANYNHKVRSSYETWYQEMDWIHFAENTADAWKKICTCQESQEKDRKPITPDAFRELIDILNYCV